MAKKKKSIRIRLLQFFYEVVQKMKTLRPKGRSLPKGKFSSRTEKIVLQFISWLKPRGFLWCGTKRKVLKSFVAEKVRSFQTHKYKRYFLPIILLILLLANIFLMFPREENSSLPQASAPPIFHLIASISAQKEPVKIDPEFSYKEEQLKKEPPVRIIIPSANIDTSVVEAPIVDGFWKTATDSASFGLGSSYPQDSGNTVIFAHAQPGLFANLGLIQKEAPIYLMTQSEWFAYKVDEIKTVLPNKVEVVSPTEDKTLTLYTCDGYRDVYRLVVIAKPA